jgi:putative endonuclease
MMRPAAISQWFGDLLAKLRFAGGTEAGARLSRVAVGRQGEQLAERFLKRQGFRIVARNFRAAGAEIDLVAMDDETLVFIEVKRRIGTFAGTPGEAVDAHKQEQIRRAAGIFVGRYRAGEHRMRFDVVAISGSGRPQIEHLKDAF